MATLLELVQSLHDESGAAGALPQTVVNATGEARRLVNWIRRADYKVQTKWINWKFLREVFGTGNVTTQGEATLAKPVDLKTWDLKTFKIIYPGDTIEYPLPAVEFEQLKGYIFDTTENTIDRVIVMPDNSLMFEPVPDGAYTIVADYYKKPVRMPQENDSVSPIPEEYHDSVILGRALIYYANFETAPEIKNQGKEMYTEGMEEMENHQLPNQNYSRNRTGGGFEVVAGQYAEDYGRGGDFGW